MSSEFGQYFEEFLGDDANDWQLQERIVSSFDITPLEDPKASLTSNTQSLLRERC